MDYNKLNKQLDRFIKSGFKESRFTKDLHEMLYIHSNVFIAHFDKAGFYRIRFKNDAAKTIELLKLVKKPNLKLLTSKLANAMQKSLATEEVINYITTVVKE